MEKSKIESLQKLQKMEQFYLLINAGTHNPFVVCDKENFNDQVWIFEVEDDMKEAAKPYMIEQKHKLIPAKIENKGYLPFFTSLFTLGVNAVVFVEKEQTTEFELTEIVKRPILEKIPEDKRPLENPALQITGTYFMQELRREVPMEEKENIKELEEEMAANLVKSKFMIAVEKPQEGKTEEEQKKEALKVFYLKSKEDKFMLPIFTDTVEFSKLNREGKYRAMVIDFKNIKKIIMPEALGMVINPYGFNLVVQLQHFDNLLTRFGMSAE